MFEKIKDHNSIIKGDLLRYKNIWSKCYSYCLVLHKNNMLIKVIDDNKIYNIHTSFVEIRKIEKLTSN